MCVCVKQYPQTPGFVGFAIHLLVWALFFLNENKNQTTGWKEETEKHRFKTAKRKKMKLSLLSIPGCIYV